MSGVCLRPILNNEPVLKWKRGNNYAAPGLPESPEAPKEDATMAGQGATAENIARRPLKKHDKTKRTGMQGRKIRGTDVRHSRNHRKTYCEIEGFGS